MTAKTKWWLCGRCGFSNHPRANSVPVYQLAADGRYDLVEGDTRCEQCGASSTLSDATDYTPREG